ncbi:meiotic nuclear division protein 1 [Jimgerdemannia flammicorona]|uniref:Meiotic nuclear division protein 1 n=1 Tax=Jimgerdemannia flammicorona TaxID=994334 RepID=A0A433QWY4_9FUNG|nr:meiotic nuclear division protein 1 [Jimgerdemannia flammicorona]
MIVMSQQRVAYRVALSIYLIEHRFSSLNHNGLSTAEKRKRLEGLFHETKEFFQLKELEKIAPKKKGIVTQSVKEVLQSLVDDNLVTTDKIGTSNYFWSFPSTALQTRKCKIDALTDEITKLKSRNAELEQAIQDASGGREETNDRAALLKELAEAESRKKGNLEELQRYRECDPTLLEAKENIFVIQSYCVKNFGMQRADFNENFAIPDDFDTIP